MLFAGGAIQRIEPDGRFGQRIELPVSRPTSCCFSPDRQLLYVTTARLGLDDEQLEQQPLAGALLVVKAHESRETNVVSYRQDQSVRATPPLAGVSRHVGAELERCGD